MNLFGRTSYGRLVGLSAAPRGIKRGESDGMDFLPAIERDGIENKTFKMRYIMGMLCHGCLAAVLLKNQEPLVFETDLDNELELTMDVDEDYFRGVKSISELKTAISNAFISKQYRTYDFESVIEDLGDISSYEWIPGC